MSIKLMSAIFETEFRDLPLPDEGGEKQRMAKASSLKLVLLAIADHANDEGESAYPGLTRLEKKTGMSRQGIIDVLSALKYNGLLSVAESPSRLGTNDYTLNLRCFPFLADPSQATLLVKPLDYPSQATLLALVKPLDLKHPLITNESLEQPLSKETPHLRGIESAIAMDRPVVEDDFIPENKPPVAVLDALSAGLHYNFPHFGENKSLDRVARLIASEVALGKDIQRFIAWAKQNKRDPRWYHLKPDSLWGDWPQAFIQSTIKQYEEPDENYPVIPKRPK